eukprot:TRINITY_DN47626_c0_g1_i1.p1 TRINITY_DN47626_c0_g1~~TRINITY_DN47626_c0_g1_i1.p1  ORF type:complete len:350 (-),score=68.77 TRINITY_DN47626_c0_g1_i1:421-1470(-)
MISAQGITSVPTRGATAAISVLGSPGSVRVLPSTAMAARAAVRWQPAMLALAAAASTGRAQLRKRGHGPAFFGRVDFKHRTARQAASDANDPRGFVPPPPRDGDYLDMFCRGANGLFEQLVLPQIRERVQLQRAGTAPKDALGKLTAAPEVPGISRPLWLVMLGSIPTALGWYGYYKFSVEEELFQEELRSKGRATGCGGYGTLFPFVFSLLLGFALCLLGFEETGSLFIGAGSLWILLGQINLYRRVNEIIASQPSVNGGEPVLWEWWALLPPPIDVIVGVRQVHFLAKAQAAARGESWEKDIVAEEWFPFISAPRFSLLEFACRPSMWFGFTKDVPDLELPGAAEKR